MSGNAVGKLGVNHLEWGVRPVDRGDRDRGLPRGDQGLLVDLSLFVSLTLLMANLGPRISILPRLCPQAGGPKWGVLRGSLFRERQILVQAVAGGRGRGPLVG